MAKDILLRTQPGTGIEQIKPNYADVAGRLVVPPQDIYNGWFSANTVGHQFNCFRAIQLGNGGTVPIISGSTTGTSGYWTATYTTAGTVGLGTNYATVLTTANSSGNKITMTDQVVWPFALNKNIDFHARIQIPTGGGTDTGWIAGLVSSTTDLFTAANITDGIWFSKTNAATAVSYNTRAASGTTNTVQLIAAQTVNVMYDVFFHWNAHNVNGGPAGWVGIQPTANYGTATNLTVAAFSSTDITNIKGQTATTLCFAFGCQTGSNNARTLTIHSARGEIEY